MFAMGILLYYIISPFFAFRMECKELIVCSVNWNRKLSFRSRAREKTNENEWCSLCKFTQFIVSYQHTAEFSIARAENGKTCIWRHITRILMPCFVFHTAIFLHFCSTLLLYTHFHSFHFLPHWLRCGSSLYNNKVHWESEAIFVFPPFCSSVSELHMQSNLFGVWFMPVSFVMIS